MRRLFVPMFVCLFSITWLMGCGGPLPNPKLVNIEGKITLDGQPLNVGDLQLHSDDSRQGPWGGTISNGTYVASAPVGKYKVTVMMPPPGDDPVPKVDPKYGDASKTPLSIEIVATPGAGAYDLVLK